MKIFTIEKNENDIYFVQIKDKNALNNYVKICRREKFLDEREPIAESSISYHICCHGHKIGYFSLDKNKDCSVCFWGFYIKPQYRKRGFADTTLLKIIKRLREMEMPTLYCLVSPQNEVARHIYEKYGYYKQTDGSFFEPEYSNELRRTRTGDGDWIMIFFTKQEGRNFYNMRETISRRIYCNDLKKFSNRKPKVAQEYLAYNKGVK